MAWHGVPLHCRCLPPAGVSHPPVRCFVWVLYKIRFGLWSDFFFVVESFRDTVDAMTTIRTTRVCITRDPPRRGVSKLAVAHTCFAGIPLFHMLFHPTSTKALLLALNRKECLTSQNAGQKTVFCK